MARPEADWDRAERLFRRRSYAAAAEAYRACLFQGGDNVPAFARLGACHLLRGDHGQAEHWLNRALDHEPRHAAALAGMAYLDLLGGRERAALYKYSVLAKDGWQTRRVRKVLDGLRTAVNTRDWAQAQPLAYFLPGPDYPRPLPRVRLLLLGGLGAVAVVSTCLLLFTPLREKVARLLPSGEGAPGGLRLVYPATPTLKAPEPTGPTTAERLKAIYLFDGLTNTDRKLTSAALVDLFEDTKRAIVKGRINQARINVNRVLASDANLLLKEKFRLLEAAIPTPTFGSFENTLTMGEAVRDAACALTWFRYAGTAGAPRAAGKAWLFDFTFIDGHETWTAEVLLERTPGVEPGAGRRYVILAQYRGFDPARKKPQLSAAVVKEILSAPR